MSKKQEKLLTISFFELMVQPDECRVAQVDWEARLAKMDDNEPRIVGYRTRELDGYVMGNEGNRCLSLTIDRVTQPRERQRGTGIRKTMKNSGEDFDPAEETVVVFFERNIFGMLGTGQGSPSSSAVALWLSKFSAPQAKNNSLTWVAKSISREDIYERVIKEKHSSVTTSTFTVEPAKLNQDELTILGLAAEHFTGVQNGLTAKIILQAGRTKSKEQNYRVIEDRVAQVMEKVPVKGARVTAKIDGGIARSFDLLGDSITHKIAIDYEVLEESDDFIEAANREIRSAYDELSDVLLEKVPSATVN